MKSAMLSALAIIAMPVVLSGCSDAVSGTTSDAPAAQLPPLVGAWRTQVHFGAGSLSDLHDLEFMYSFNAGGTLTQSSNYDGTPPVPPGYGVWRQTGPHSFELRYAFYAPAKFVKQGRSAAWVPTGRGLYTESLQVSADGRSYKSRIVYDMVDPKGQPMAGGGEGEAVGQRTTFDSPP